MPGDDPVADVEVTDPRADGIHHPGDLAAGDVGKRRSDLIAPLDHQAVHEAECGRLNADADLMGLGHRNRSFDQPEVIEGAESIAFEAFHL